MSRSKRCAAWRFDHVGVTAVIGALLAGVAMGWLLSAGDRPVPGSPPALSNPLWDSDDLYGPCAVTRVIDGDTVEVGCAGARTRVRLLNVDAPERGQPGYREARDALANLTHDHPIYLIFEEPGLPSCGKYGRLLAYVVLESGTNLNLTLIREGWSPFYRKYGDGRFAEAFLQAETDAQTRKLGLWAMR